MLEWLADDLNQQISYIPARTWRVWLETDRILPLLDGLDEVAEKHREACVTRINEFRGQKASLRLVVCSRTQDYGSLNTKLQMPGAAEVQPLKPGRGSQFLEQAGEPVAGVRAALRGDATLWEVLDTPLMLNIAMLAYQGVPGMQLSGTLEERRATLFSKYVDAAFKRRVKEVPYSREQAIRWVARLAAVLVRQGQTIFHPESLQPNWLGLRSSRVVGLVYGLVGGLVYGLGGGLVVGLGGGVGLGLVFGLEKDSGFFIQHWVLRFLLWRKGFAPLRYVRFLDYAAERVFLRKVGGSYIFIHRMLMEHFASMYEKEPEAVSKAQSAAG